MPRYLADRKFTATKYRVLSVVAGLITAVQRTGWK
jgi:hypothetical protein